MRPHATEVQALSARWRQLASRAYRSMASSNRRTSQKYRDTTVALTIEFLWCVMGRANNRDAVNTRVMSRDSIIRGLDRLWTTIFETVRSVREQLLAHDYQLVLVRSGARYMPENMTTRGNIPRGNHMVLCSSGLGMERLTSTIKGDGKDVSPSAPEIKLVVNPEVHLEYLIDEFLRYVFAIHYREAALDSMSIPRRTR
jgi:hypothetical protein